MGDMGELFNDWRQHKKEMRAALGVLCPQCKIVRPKAHPTILLPGQRCKVDGYRDPRSPKLRDTFESSVMHPAKVSNDH